MDHICGAAILGLSISILAGCGTAEYERRLEKSGDLLRYGSKFHAKLHPSPQVVNDTGVSIRFPLLIDGSARAGTDQPPFVQLPGLQFSYVKDVNLGDVRSGTSPVHLYIGVVNADAMQDTEIMNKISVTLSNQFQNVPAIWDQVELDTPDRSSISCKHISVTGEQTFDKAMPYQDAKPVDAAGRFDVYLYSTDTKHVITAWRCPDDIQANTQWFQLAGVSTGTITIETGEGG